MKIVLHQPEIPANTGNIGRTCVATGTSLHLIEPLGFRINEKELKRAGMDYWDKLDVQRYINYEDFCAQNKGATVWMATTKAKKSYTDVTFGPDDFIMFGKESAGIPEEILVENEEHCIRIPMGADIRSLNLSNSVAIVLYEALRQQGFASLEKKGNLHRLSWTDDKSPMTTSESGEVETVKVENLEKGNVSNAYIAESAVVSGNVTLGKNVGIWHNATVRGDMQPIVVGDDTNIQDNAVLHTAIDYPIKLGNRITVGHGAIIHGCEVEDDCMIGMGAIVMNGAHIGKGSIIAAGALIPEGKDIPAGSVVMGMPGKIVRQTNEADAKSISDNCKHYVELAHKSNTKALVLDIDGTLTNSKKEITEATRDAIWRILDAGHKVILASGRPTPGMRRYEDELELGKRGGFLLSFNGARVIDCTTRETLVSKVLPLDIPAKLYPIAKEWGAGLISYEGDTVISAFEPDEYVILETRINNIPVKTVENFAEYVNFPVNKCLMTAPPEMAEKLEKELQRIFGDTLSIYRSEAFFVEIMPKGTTKADSLNELIGDIGVLRENTICCGDGFNDISMIEYAGCGVAMGNAKPEVKAAADYITATNDEDGLVPVIEKFIMK